MNVTTSRRPSPACHSPLPGANADAATSRLILNDEDGDDSSSNNNTHNSAHVARQSYSRSRQTSGCVELGLDPVEIVQSPPLSPLF